MTATGERPLSARDYSSDQEVRWCPGCGDYAILKAIHKTLADLEVPREKTVFISGIGCAARFPYYVSTYGFHTIHGRAPAIATGTKLANPELDIWVISGDGDALSIGGNHLLHVLRRNVDLQLILFNNEIYGLTKGQYSPTSRRGTRSPSTPLGSVDTPVSAGAFALGAGARFFARTIDTQQKHEIEMFKRAHAHHGTSLVEVFQNCIVFNDGAFSQFTDRKTGTEHQLLLEHGKAMVFGKENEKGIRLDARGLRLEVVTLGEGGVTEADLMVHDETNRALAQMLVAMEPPALPVALGVIYCAPAERSYEEDVHAQAAEAGEDGDLAALLASGHTWTVAG